MELIRHLAFMMIKVLNNLTTDSSKVRNDGEVEASSTFMGRRTLNLHVPGEEGKGCAQIFLLCKELILRKKRERRTLEGNMSVLEAAGWRVLSLVLP